MSAGKNRTTERSSAGRIGRRLAMQLVEPGDQRLRYDRHDMRFARVNMTGIAVERDPLAFGKPLSGKFDSALYLIDRHDLAANET